MNDTDIFNAFLKLVVGLMTTIASLLTIGMFIVSGWKGGIVLLIPTVLFWLFLGWLNGVSFMDVVNLIRKK